MKERASKIEITLELDEFGWQGDIIVNAQWAGAVSASTAEAVIDELWAGAFADQVSGVAVFTTEPHVDKILAALRKSQRLMI